MTQKMPQLSISRPIGVSAAVMAALALSACSTVGMPNLDSVKLPEFRKELTDVSDYPAPEDAPGAPEDVRSAAEWDRAAKEMQSLRNNFNAPDAPDALPPAEFDAEFAAAQRAAKAYKDDDPK